MVLVSLTHDQPAAPPEVAFLPINSARNWHSTGISSSCVVIAFVFFFSFCLNITLKQYGFAGAAVLSPSTSLSGRVYGSCAGHGIPCVGKEADSTSAAP